MPSLEVRKPIDLLLERRVVLISKKPPEHVVPGNEDEIGNGRFLANEILLIGKDAIEDSKDTNDLSKQAISSQHDSSRSNQGNKHTSFWYLSMAEGSFSGWKLPNQAACPK